MFEGCLVSKVLPEPKPLENRVFLADVFSLYYKRPHIQDLGWDLYKCEKILASLLVCAERVPFQVAPWNSLRSGD